MDSVAASSKYFAASLGKIVDGWKTTEIDHSNFMWKNWMGLGQRKIFLGN